MKKIDNATGLTIEIPSGEVRGNFPYYGFWAEQAPRLVKNMKDRGKINASESDITFALTQLMELINGPYRVLLADRLWKIGETISLNGNISLTGYHGGAIRIVQEAPDGGKSQFAAFTFEKPVKMILDSSTHHLRSQSSLANIASTVQNGNAEIQRLNIELIALESKKPSTHQISQIQTNLRGLTMQIQQIQHELQEGEKTAAHLENRLQEYGSLAQEMKSMSLEKETVGRQLQQTLNRLQALENLQPAGSITQHSAEMNTLSNKASQLGNRNMQLHQRLSNLGIQLERERTTSNSKAEVRQVQAAVRMNRQRLTAVTNQYQGLLAEEQRTLAEINEINNAIQETSSYLRTKVRIVESARTQLENARSTAANIPAFRAEDIVKVFGGHLTDVQRDIERYLFKNLQLSQAAISGRATSRMVGENIVSAETVKDYEAFLTAMDDIGDALGDDEYDLVEKIAKFGASQEWVPGATRVMALLDMSRTERTEAYRNMIEEILTEGVSAQTVESTGAGLIANFSAGNMNIKFDFSRPLNELESLVNHLSNSGLEFQFKGRDD